MAELVDIAQNALHGKPVDAAAGDDLFDAEEDTDAVVLPNLLAPLRPLLCREDGSPRRVVQAAPFAVVWGCFWWCVARREMPMPLPRASAQRAMLLHVALTGVLDRRRQEC